MVRPTSLSSHLRGPGVELVTADLAEPATLDPATRGAGAVIATANAVAPTHGRSFDAVEERGYAALLDACVRNGCGRFVLIPIPVTSNDARVSVFRTKRHFEHRLAASGLEFAVLRAGPFMDDGFALIGSALPARGDEAPVIRRRWPFLQRFVAATGSLTDRHGIGECARPSCAVRSGDERRCASARLGSTCVFRWSCGPGETAHGATDAGSSDGHGNDEGSRP